MSPPPWGAVDSWDFSTAPPHGRDGNCNILVEPRSSTWHSIAVEFRFDPAWRSIARNALSRFAGDPERGRPSSIWGGRLVRERGVGGLPRFQPLWGGELEAFRVLNLSGRAVRYLPRSDTFRIGCPASPGAGMGIGAAGTRRRSFRSTRNALRRVGAANSRLRLERGDGPFGSEARRFAASDL